MSSVGTLIVVVVLAQSVTYVPSNAAPGPSNPNSDSPPAKAADLEFFEKRVRPILIQRCGECHSSTGKDRRGGLVLDRRQAILDGGDSGPAAIPGSADTSLLIRAVRYRDELLQMPPAGKLPDAEIDVLAEWVRLGLPFPSEQGRDRSRRTIDIEAGRNHWAFRPLQRQPLPAETFSLTVENRTDAYLASERHLRGLSPSPPADSATLMRRAKFDLCGVPPQFEELQEFASDLAPDAYDRLLDRYLATPQHGERWARFWLDLARYCDVMEQWRTGSGQPWLYRDWVVSAFNRDLPYESFVRLQLAADLIPASQPADLAALGFLGLSPSYWKELKLDHKVIMQVVAEEWEERIEAIGATYLGLTVACARCHDHKFDPITTRDYYGLAGVLASIKLDDRPLLAPAVANSVVAARDQETKLRGQLAELNKSKEPCSDKADQIAKLERQLADLRKTPEFDAPFALVVSEAAIVVSPDGPHRTRIDYRPGVAQDVALHVRGNVANQGERVPRKFLSVLSRPQEEQFAWGSGRLELANSIVGSAAPLAARVFVNRIWFHHFGRGLVTTLSNFGIQTEPPSHPELLDDLASRFIEDGWSTKRLHREMMLTSAYRQSSRRDGARHARDPDNVWLWRMQPRRLEVEAWRDTILAITGELDLAVGRQPADIKAATNRRRTLYGRVTRRELDDIFRLHDFPDPVAHSAHREPTITPLQQLFALNSPFAADRSRALVERVDSTLDSSSQSPDDSVAGDPRKIELYYRYALSRLPTTKELALGGGFIEACRRRGDSSQDAWRQYAQVLLSCNELLFVD